MAVVLDLVVDSTGVQSGARTAEQALSGVQQASTKTQASLAAIGPNTNKSIQAVAGVSQIGRNITEATRAFSDLNFQSLAFVGANLALSVTKTASAFDVLKVALRTNPLFVIATTLGVIATAMSFFGDKTEEATQKIDQQAQALDRLIGKARELDAAKIYATPGQKDPRQSTASTVETLLALRKVPSATPYYAGEAASLFGVSEQELRYALARTGLGEDALSLRFPQNRVGGAAPGTTMNPWSMTRFSAGQLIGAGESILRERQGVQPSPYTAGDVEAAAGMSRSWAAAEEAAREANAEALRKQKEADDAHIAALERMIGLSAQVGAALGAGVWDVLNGLQGWRQLLMGLFNQFGRQGLSSLGANLFGTTARQATGRTSPGGGGGGGGGGVEVGFGGLG